MNKHISTIGMVGLGVLLLAAPVFADDQLALKTIVDKDSYKTGVDFVRSLKQRGGQIDLDLVIRGMKDGLTGENMLMSDEDLRKDFATRERESAEKQAQTASPRDTSSADAGRNSEPSAPQKQIDPEGRPEHQAAPNAALALKDGQTQTPVRIGQSGRIAPVNAGMAGKSVIEIDRARSETRSRALELRRKMIEQNRRNREMAGRM